jgi:hypothetical protein
MNREDIIKLAREQGLPETETEGVFRVNTDDLGRMLAAEREACAKVCDAVQKKNEDDGAWMWEARNCAAAIRARGDQ